MLGIGTYKFPILVQVYLLGLCGGCPNKMLLLKTAIPASGPQLGNPQFFREQSVRAHLSQLLRLAHRHLLRLQEQSEQALHLFLQLLKLLLQFVIIAGLILLLLLLRALRSLRNHWRRQG
jgi:hypothetical protein